MLDSAPTSPSRPVLRWHGGKWRLAPWIIAHLPPHRTYVEPYGGAASVLIQKPRAYAEVYNDLDDDVVGLFRVLRDPARSELLRSALRLTPFARAEFRLAYESTDDPVERARRLIVRSFMGFGSNAHASAANGHRSTGFRSNVTRSSTTPAADWRGYPDALSAIIDRLRGVVIECRPALDVMRRHDGGDTLLYVDPPYLPETRVGLTGRRQGMYRHEMAADDHAELLAWLGTARSMVALSGYDCPLYAAMLAGWRCLTRSTYADGARPRTECLWLNPRAVEALEAAQAGPLFGWDGAA